MVGAAQYSAAARLKTAVQCSIGSIILSFWGLGFGVYGSGFKLGTGQRLIHSWGVCRVLRFYINVFQGLGCGVL